MAFVEFAMSLPVLLTLGLGGLETAHLAIAHLRVSNMASLAADNAARVRDSIDEANVIELLTGSKMTGSGIDFAANGRIILSSVEATDDGRAQWIRWQRCDGALNVSSSYGMPRTADGAPILDGTEFLASDRQTESDAPSSEEHPSAQLGPIGPEGRQITAQPGTAIMVVEVVYNYQPLVGEFLLGTREIRYESAYNVRQRTDQALRNGGATEPMSCDTFEP